MSENTTRNDGDIRRRALWLLLMLAVVAALLVFVLIEFFGHSGDGGNSHNGAPYVDPDPSPTAPRTPGSGSASSNPDASSGAPTGNTTSPSAASLPSPSCPSGDTCNVTGDLSGVAAAINQIRSEQGRPAVPVTTTAAAQHCALTAGGDCPTSFVWVHVKGLSGQALVSGVQGFGSGDDLLDEQATSFEVGWAYDPSGQSLSAAVIRNS